MFSWSAGVLIPHMRSHCDGGTSPQIGTFLAVAFCGIRFMYLRTGDEGSGPFPLSLSASQLGRSLLCGHEQLRTGRSQVGSRAQRRDAQAEVTGALEAGRDAMSSHPPLWPPQGGRGVGAWLRRALLPRGVPSRQYLYRVGPAILGRPRPSRDARPYQGSKGRAGSPSPPFAEGRASSRARSTDNPDSVRPRTRRSRAPTSAASPRGDTWAW